MVTRLNFQEALEILNKNTTLKAGLEHLIHGVFSKKDVKIDVDLAKSEYKELIDRQILTTNDKITYYYFSFNDSLSCAVLLEYAINLLGRPFPDNPYDGAKFIKDFFVEICKPKVNCHWYTSGVGRNFRNFAFLEYEEYFNEHFQKLKDIFKNDHPQNSNEDYLKTYLCYTILKYNFTISQIFELAILFYKDKQNKGQEIDLLEKVASKSFELAEGLLHLSKVKYYESGNSSFFLPILCGLSKFDIEQAILESIELLNNSETEVVGLNCLGWLNYKTEKQIVQSYEIIKLHITKNEDYHVLLPRMYRNFIENSMSSFSLKQTILAEFLSLLDHSSEKVLYEVRFWLESISGFEEEKMKFLVAFLNKGLKIDFGHFFQKFDSPLYLFNFVKLYYVNLGLGANIGQFKTAFDEVQIKDPEKFEEGLKELLSNQYSIIRKAGVDILISKHFGVHDINLLDLSEQRQAIVMDTLLAIPIEIEKVLPFALQLKDSSYPKIREGLKLNCIQLIYSFEELIPEILNSSLDIKKQNDKEILELVVEAWNAYEKILDQKRKMLELSPFINQYKLTEMFYRQEREHNQEQMQEAQKDSLWGGFAKHVPVLRGSAFKLEGKDQGINRLGKIETKIALDKRYFLNPSFYEVAFKKHILWKNYSIDSE